MPKQPTFPSEMAARLAALFPPALTPALLEDYRLERVAAQIPQITRELLSLTMFWVTSALEAHYRGIGDVLVLPEVKRLLGERWTRVYGFPASDWGLFLAALSERYRAYEGVQAEGGSAVAVSTLASAQLESEWVVRSEEQPHLLALMVDLVPVEAIGALFEQIELVAPS